MTESLVCLVAFACWYAIWKWRHRPSPYAKAMRQLKREFDRVSIEIGDRLLPAMRGMADALRALDGDADD